mmetsp:Transcript_7677/g.11909  ORF Transcript_7677/g.11909 Transcript_7677/m.11909 type:complete len:206 (-) Transcript_7677:142-759(-)
MEGEPGNVVLAFDWTQLTVDEKYCQILGYEEDELVGRKMWDLIHIADVEKCQSMVANSARSGKGTVTFTNKMNCKDGSLVIVSTEVRNIGKKEMICLIHLISSESKETRHLWNVLNDRVEEFKRASRELKSTRLSKHQKELVHALENVVYSMERIVMNNTAGPRSNNWHRQEVKAKNEESKVEEDVKSLTSEQLEKIGSKRPRHT